MSIIGLDVGGSKTAIVEGSIDGEILQRTEIETQAHLPFHSVFPDIAEIVRTQIKTAVDTGRTIEALSVSIGGPLRIESGHILNPPHLPGWHDLPLSDILREEFPDYRNFVEHDGNAGALAEFRFGVGKSYPKLKHLIFLTFGTGLGAGIVVNGAVLRGASDTAGEIGHWRMRKTGPPGFSKFGSWEAFASGAGMLHMARTRYPHRWTDETTVRMLVDDMLQDDPDALQIAEEIGCWLGRGIALLVDALNPQIVVLGRLAGILGDRILAPLQHELEKEALPQAVAAVTVTPCALGSALGDVAALMAAITYLK